MWILTNCVYDGSSDTPKDRVFQTKEEAENHKRVIERNIWHGMLPPFWPELYPVK